MSQISGSLCLFYNMHIPPPCLKSTVKAKTDDSLWGKTPCGSIKLSIQLLTGLMRPFHSTELERAILPRAAQGWPKGRHGLTNKTWQPRTVIFSCFGLHIAKSETPPQRWNLKCFFSVKGPVLPGQWIHIRDRGRINMDFMKLNHASKVLEGRKQRTGVNNSFHSAGKSTEDFLRGLCWNHVIWHIHKC